MTMYWTEEEAKRKWCPMSRGIDGPTPLVGFNRDAEGKVTDELGCNCVASRCMMWRQATFFRNTKTGEVPIKPGLHEPGTVAECGYCGLAGVPPIFEDAEPANR